MCVRVKCRKISRRQTKTWTTKKKKKKKTHTERERKSEQWNRQKVVAKRNKIKIVEKCFFLYKIIEQVLRFFLCSLCEQKRNPFGLCLRQRFKKRYKQFKNWICIISRHRTRSSSQRGDFAVSSQNYCSSISSSSSSHHNSNNNINSKFAAWYVLLSFSLIFSVCIHTHSFLYDDPAIYCC